MIGGSDWFPESPRSVLADRQQAIRKTNGLPATHPVEALANGFRHGCRHALSGEPCQLASQPMVFSLSMLRLMVLVHLSDRPSAPRQRQLPRHLGAKIEEYHLPEKRGLYARSDKQAFPGATWQLTAEDRLDSRSPVSTLLLDSAPCEPAKTPLLGFRYPIS